MYLFHICFEVNIPFYVISVDVKVIHARVALPHWQSIIINTWIIWTFPSLGIRKCENTISQLFCQRLIMKYFRKIECQKETFWVFYLRSLILKQKLFISQKFMLLLAQKRRHPILYFHSAHLHRVTTVALDCYHCNNATESSSHNSHNSHKKNELKKQCGLSSKTNIIDEGSNAL